RHQAAAGDPVELGDAGAAARGRRLGTGQPDELEPPAAAGPQAARRAVALQLLDDGVPGAARLAPAAPFRLAGAAALADEKRLYLGHGVSRQGGEGRASGRPLHSALSDILIGPSARPWMNCST